MKNKNLSIFVLLAGVISTAHAEGKFDGPYLGISYGTAWGNVSEGTGHWADQFSLYTTEGKSSDFGSAAIGINAGYNFSLSSNNVIGIEIDNHYLNDTANGEALNYDTSFNIVSDRLLSETSINNIQTLRLKLGHVFGDLHLYGTLGLAHTNVDRKVTQVDDGRGYQWFAVGASNRKEESIFGYALGAGADYSINDKLMMNAKYLFTDFGDTTYHYSGVAFGIANSVGKQKVGINNSMLTLGVSYHF